MSDRALVLELHDVSPYSWPAYRPFVDAVDALGRVPITWLVVPDFHGRHPLERAPDFCRLLSRRGSRGDELVLHGCLHRDDAPPPRSLGDWWVRRVLTHEGEFRAIAEAEARRRLARGLALFRTQDWPLGGFVAPAWQMNGETRRVLAESPLRYTSDPWRLYLLPAFRAIEAPTLVWSARSVWRRGLSWAISEARLPALAEAPLLRLALHPVDMRHAFARRYWLRLLERLLAAGRRPLTQANWLARQAPEEGASA